MKLTGSSPVTGSMPKRGPEKAINPAARIPSIVPAQTPSGLAKGTKKA